MWSGHPVTHKCYDEAQQKRAQSQYDYVLDAVRFVAHFLANFPTVKPVCVATTTAPHEKFAIARIGVVEVSGMTTPAGTGVRRQIAVCFTFWFFCYKIESINVEQIV